MQRCNRIKTTFARLCIAGFMTMQMALCLAAQEPAAPTGSIQLEQDDEQGVLRILLDGREAIVYQYGQQLDLAHYYPVRSPSGKLLTIQQTDPYPHHRSVWFADTVQLDGKRKVSFYNALYSRVDKTDPESPFRDQVRHVEFVSRSVSGERAQVVAKLLWEMDLDVPVLDEQRAMTLVDLGDGEYFVDLLFALTAKYGDVAFVSDAVHYAWPYVRMHPQFSGDNGGRLVNSEGGIGQSQTNNQVARWIDYSNTVEGVTEGLAVFSHPDNPYPHRWLTREYGTFGPRREDQRSGKPFTLKQGDRLQQRVGILVHRGDVDGGKVKQRYQQYIDGDL
jgi:hypothetical protein